MPAHRGGRGEPRARSAAAAARQSRGSGRGPGNPGLLLQHGKPGIGLAQVLHDGVPVVDLAQAEVPCAMSPSTVSDPLMQRRPPSARHCIGLEILRLVNHHVAQGPGRARSGRPARRGATASARVHLADFTPAGRLGPQQDLFLLGRAPAPRRRPRRQATPGRRSSRNSTCSPGVTLGHTASRNSLIGLDLATASWSRSSGASPRAASICNSTKWARRCATGGAARAVAPAAPKGIDRLGDLPGLCFPPGTVKCLLVTKRNSSLGGLMCAHSARCSTSAIRASPSPDAAASGEPSCPRWPCGR